MSLGRIDITTAVMSMSGFRVATRKGHLERVQRIISYLVKMRHATLRFHNTEEPDFSTLPNQYLEWAYNCLWGC